MAPVLGWHPEQLAEAVRWRTLLRQADRVALARLELQANPVWPATNMCLRPVKQGRPR